MRVSLAADTFAAAVGLVPKSVVVYVAEVRPLEINVTAYAPPVVPVMPKLVYVAMPALAVWISVPIRDPLLIDAVTEAVLPVIVLPPASRTATFR